MHPEDIQYKYMCYVKFISKNNIRVFSYLEKKAETLTFLAIYKS